MVYPFRVRILLQRVLEGSVRVEDEIVGAVGPGFVLLVGAGPGDTDATAAAMAQKVAQLRIFPDEAGKMNLSLLDTGGGALVVSQFTLYADTRKGRRPSFTGAAAPDLANKLVEAFAEALRGLGVPRVEQGIFGANMQVSLVNDGPVTIWLDSEEK